KARQPERYKQAYELLMMEQARERVINQVVCKELPEDDAKELVDEAWIEGRSERHAEGDAEVNRGTKMVLLGIVVTIALSALLRPIGFSIFVWGPVLFGIG